MARLAAFVILRVVTMALCVSAASLPGAAQGDPPGATILAQADPDAAPEEGQPSGAAALLIRVERLEDRLRTLTGQVEQLQFQNKKLDDQLRKMQQDVDFRFQDLNRAPAGAPARPAPAKRGDASEPALGTATVDAGPPPVPAAPAVEAPRPAKRVGDAFDPAAHPDAPGAPRPLGTTPPSAPLTAGVGSGSAAVALPATAATTPHAPLDLMPNGLSGTARVDPAPVEDAALAVDAGTRGIIAPSTPPVLGGGPRADYDVALGLYKSAQYDGAIEGFQTFLQKYPKDRLVPDATYFLGESFSRQGRQREAAEQFLKLSTDYTKSSRAPDALLRLGVALNALGAKEQACATYQEVDHRYPTASSDVRAGVERELKRSKC